MYTIDLDGNKGTPKACAILCTTDGKIGTPQVAAEWYTTDGKIGTPKVSAEQYTIVGNQDEYIPIIRWNRNIYNQRMQIGSW